MNINITNITLIIMQQGTAKAYLKTDLPYQFPLLQDGFAELQLELPAPAAIEYLNRHFRGLEVKVIYE